MDVKYKLMIDILNSNKIKQNIFEFVIVNLGFFELEKDKIDEIIQKTTITPKKRAFINYKFSLIIDKKHFVYDIIGEPNDENLQEYWNYFEELSGNSVSR